MTYLAVDPATELPDPHDGPPTEPVPAPVPAPAPSVPLTRLIGLARLTPPQALEVAAGLLAEAAQRPEPDAAIDRVAVDADGRVVLGPAGDSSRNGRPSARGPDIAGVLAQVAAAARIGGRPADPAAGDLLDELDRAVTELPAAGVPAVAASLQQAAAAVDRSAVRAELGALVAALAGGPAALGAAAGGRSGGAAAGGRSTGGRAGTAGRGRPRRRRTGLRRTGAWLASVVVLAAVVLLEVGFLRDRIDTDIGLLLDAGRSGSAAATAPKADGLPIVPPAPAAAGSVTGVDLRPLTRCAPGAPCTLRLLVQVVPDAAPRDVTWSYLVVDRCTGATSTAPGGTVTVPDGGGRATAVGTVMLPAAPGVAVLAVTDLPAAAASAPVVVGSCLPTPAG